MKPIVFFGTVEEGTNTLFVESNKNYHTVSNDFSLRIKEGHFEISNIEKEENWLRFKKVKRHTGETYLLIEGNQKQIYKKDNIEIILEEYKPSPYPMIAQAGKNYKAKEDLKIQGYGGSAVIKILEVNEKGEAILCEAEPTENFFAEGHKSFFPDGGSGEGLEVVCDMVESDKRTILDKTVKNSYFAEGKNFINFEYEVPEFIEQGQIKVFRTKISLDKPCEEDLSEGVLCVAQKIDYTEKLGIPMVEQGTINSYNLYNQGAAIIEKKLLELENRIQILESRP